jgi:hypothetical protein
MRLAMSRFKNESGVAMIIALGVLLVLMALTGVALSAALKANSFSNRDAHTKRAFEAAQAGLQATVYRLNMQLNSSTEPIATLNAECMGGPSATTETEEALESPALPPGGSERLDCYPYHESLGNGASYTAWTSRVFSGAPTCAGVEVGTINSVNQRCVTSEGIVEQGGQRVTHRVQERIAAFNGRPVFKIAGVSGEQGVRLRSSAKVFGPISTNGQLEARNTSTASSCVLGENDTLKPIVEQGASIGEPCRRETWSKLGPFSPVPAALAEGNRRIENFFNHTGKEEDKFSGGQCTREYPLLCGWNKETRTIELPNGVEWELSGENYNLCSLGLKGSSHAVLKLGVKTSIYIVSTYNEKSEGCPLASKEAPYLSVEQKAAFINNSPKLAGSPLEHDTTALKIWISGSGDVKPDTLANNACNAPGDTGATCVALGQTTAFYGTVYAPSTDIQVGQGGQIFGAIAGQSVIYGQSATFQEDSNVPSVVTTGALGIYFPTAWTECGSSTPPASGDPMSGC